MSYLLTPEAATGAGAGDWMDAQIRDTDSISMDIVITGAPTTVVVSIQRRLEKGPAATLATHTFTAAELSAGVAAIGIGGFMADQLRYNVITLSGGSSPTINFHTRA